MMSKHKFPIKRPHDELDLENVHDQLTSVEDNKALISKITKDKKTYWILAFFSILLIVLSITVALPTTYKIEKLHNGSNKNDQTQQVFDFLFSTNVSSLPDLQDERTAHHKAATFVAGENLHTLKLNDQNGHRIVERYILSLLYFHLSGPEWNFNLNFLSPRDHCDWWEDLKTHSGETVRRGVTCNEEGYISTLNLAWNGLDGDSIPREIGHLGKLESLQLYFSNIGGFLPDAFRNMTSLKDIGLMKTGIRGSIPEWIGELTRLTSLGLSDNRLLGEVPESIGNLKKLKLLGLDGNGGLTGNIKRFYPLVSLEALYLENNAFTGHLGSSGNWPQIQEVDVSNNMLDGIVPSSLLNNENLVAFDAHKNMLDGPFPDDLLKNENLQYLALHDNLLHGTISDRLGFLGALKHLDISFNVFTGTIPDTLVELTDLRYLATSGNKFREQKLADVSYLTNLVDLSMKGNKLIGTIPDDIGALSNLKILDLDRNALTGRIPSWIGLIQGLEHLLLNQNKLTGTIPTVFQNFHNLKTLFLDGNSITGHADAICESDSVHPGAFVSDCYPGTDGSRPKVECRCCTQCCADGDRSCNNKFGTPNLDPIWEYGLHRPNYALNLDNAPESFSKEEEENTVV